MNWTVEVILVPVADVLRAKEFYAQRLGFPVDHDTKVSDALHFVQLTPPGSGCSIVISNDGRMTPGSLHGMQLVVPDIRAAHAELTEHGVEIGEVQVAERTGGFRPARDDETGTALDNVGFLFFTDPDGNTWAVQQISARGR